MAAEPDSAAAALDAGSVSAGARPSTSAGEPVPTLDSRHVMAITVGIVVGAGIFRTPSLVAGAAADAWSMLAAWAVGGLLSIVGALCYAELAAAYPHAGGDYRYLARAFGLRLAFLYAWARLAVIQTGSVALLAFVFGDYLAAIFGGGAGLSALFAVGAVVLLTAINWLGIRQGAGTQSWLTAIEVLGLVLVIVAGLFLAPAAAPALPPTTETQIGLVMVFVLLTYGGWNEAVYVSAEMRDSRRLMGRVLVASLVLVTLLYVLANAAYLRVLGLAGVAETEAVAAEVMQRAFGPAGMVLMSAMVAVAALTSANATLITGARSAFALGRDHRLFAPLGRWDEKRGTPGVAILVQGGVALLLVLLGAQARSGFQTAVEYTAPVFWFFFLLVGLAIFVLRAREPEVERPFRVPLYPVLPIIFCLTNAYLLYSSLAFTGAGALVGVAVLLAGGVLLLFLRRDRWEETSK